MTRRLVPACVAVALLASACGSPPSKEMDQAQGAIDTARSAGADTYAAAEYTAAVDALAKANAAVTERDYRLALSQALESREHAQSAAREAADARAAARAGVERAMAELGAAIAQAEARLETARRARVPARQLKAADGAIATMKNALQKAGTAAAAGNLAEADAALEGTKARIQEATLEIEARLAPQPRRRRR